MDFAVMRKGGKMDRITLKDALESDVWKMVWAGEPRREISVEMTYHDLMGICKLITDYLDYCK